MPWEALLVKTDATPDHVNRLLDGLDAPIPLNKQVHAVLIQALWTNTGRVVIGDRSDIKATVPQGHVLAALPPPTTNIYPSANAGNPLAPAAHDLNQIYWCVQNSGDGIICSFLT